MQRQPHDHQSEHRAAPPRPEQAADQQVVDRFLASLGPLRRQGQQMIHYAHDTGIPGRDIQAAAEAAAADDSPLNRLQAANVYVIGRAAGHPAAAAISSGQVRVDAVGSLPDGVVAAYVAVDAPHLVHDTIYVQPDLTVDDLGKRSVIIHELQHAEQDRDPAHAVDQGQHLSKARAEWEAYRTQARYVIDQIRAVSGTARQSATEQVAGSLSLHLAWMLLLEVKQHRDQLEPLVAPILFAGAPPPLPRDQQGLDSLLNASEGELESRASRAMESDYEAHGLSPDSDAAFDGYTGHSEADVGFRTGRRPEGSQATP